MSFEEYIRTTQLPNSGSPRTKILAPTRSSTARTAGGGVAAIRPRGQTPFDAFIQAVEELPIDEEAPAAPLDPTGENPGFPGSDDVRDDAGTPILGSPPAVGGRGVAEDGTFVGAPPRGGHGADLSIGGGLGTGRGDGASGLLYVCGAQTSCELGLGSVSPGPVSPPKLVRGIPAVSQVGGGAKATLALTSDRALLVAGEGTQTGGTVLVALNPEFHEENADVPDGFVDIGRAQSSDPFSPAARSGAVRDGSLINPSYAGQTFFQPFWLMNPSSISAFRASLLNGSGFPGNYSSNPTFSVLLYRGGFSAVSAGTAQLVGTFSASPEPYQEVIEFQEVGGGSVSLPAGEYTAALSFRSGNTGFSVTMKKSTTDGDFSVGYYSNSGAVSSAVRMSDTAGDFCASIVPMARTGEVAALRRISSVVQVSSGEGYVASGLRLFVRGVFASGSISAKLADAYGEVFKGVAKLDREAFPGGVGFLDVPLGTPVHDGSYTLTLDAFGADLDVGTVSEPGASLSGVSSAGSLVESPDFEGKRLAFGVVRSTEDLQPVPGYGKNLGVAMPEREIASFVTAADDYRFASRTAFLVAEEGAVLGGGGDLHSTGVTAFGDSVSWRLLLDPPGVQLLAGSPDGSAIVLKYGKLFSVGDSSNGRLGFSGSSSSLREAQGPSFVDRGKLTPLSGVVRDSSGRLYGAGRGLSGGWNAVPQVGLSPAQNPANSFRFALIRSEAVAIDAWDLGGDAENSFILASDAGGLRATGRLAGAFEFDAWTQLDARPFAWIRCGARHALLLTSEGDLYALGDNGSGQLGLPLSVPFAAVPTFVAGGIARAFASENKTFIIAA
jgi:hypothetical protein